MGEGVSDIIYGSRGAQVSFTQNFRLLTPLLKILDIRVVGGRGV